MVSTIEADSSFMPPSPVNAYGSLDQFARYRLWKDQHVPLLYDWLTSRVLSWPHGALQWGASVPPPANESFRRPFSSTAPSTSRTLFMAERTEDPSKDPNTLIQYEVRVVNELVNKPSEIAKPWIDNGAANDRDMNANRDFVLRKRICHPGEVNAIRLISPTVVVTHTDSPNLFLWDMQRQPHRKPSEKQINTPTCVLVGHEKNAEFAVDVSPHGISSTSASDATVVSGGSDHHVLLWRLRDYEACGGQLRAAVSMRGSATSGTSVSNTGVAGPSSGHSDIVEDVSISSMDPSLVVSVGRDSTMILWDVRDTSRPTLKVTEAHVGDINCCSIGGINGQLIATGGADHVLRLWDVRKLKGLSGSPSALTTLRGHIDQVTNVSWNRFEHSVLASGSDDGDVLIWRLDTNKDSEINGTDDTTNGISMEPAHSRELLFRHVGHKMTPSKITDLDWLPHTTDRWCVASLSESQYGGSTVQLWRMSDLVHRPKQDIVDDLERHSSERAN